jgi:hypothetical protein
MKKLTLAELKAKAAKTDKKEALEKVQGGNFADCHGFLGPIGKWWRGEADSIIWDI